TRARRAAGTSVAQTPAEALGASWRAEGRVDTPRRPQAVDRRARYRRGAHHHARGPDEADDRTTLSAFSCGTPPLRVRAPVGMGRFRPNVSDFRGYGCVTRTSPASPLGGSGYL